MFAGEISMFLWFPSIFPGFSHGSSHQSVASVAALGQSQSGIAAVNNGQRKRSRWNQGCVAWGQKSWDYWLWFLSPSPSKGYLY